MIKSKSPCMVDIIGDNMKELQNKNVEIFIK